MKTSAAGRAAIEGREGRRLIAYRDSRGIWTIGVGHAATGLPPLPHAGMTISEAECDALLAADLAPVEAAIAKVVTITITQNQFDAMASLAFNIGVGGFERSSVVRDLNAGHYKAAADAFLMWAHPASLEGRRQAERKQFLAPDSQTVHAAVIPPAPVAQHDVTIALVPRIPPAPGAPARPATEPSAARQSLMARLAAYFGRH